MSDPFPDLFLAFFVSSDEKRNGHSDFEGFHTQLDCKLTYGNKNQAQLALAFRVQKQNRT